MAGEPVSKPATLNTMSLFRFKIVMLGAPSVGKTSLVRRFVHSVFEESYHSTLGAKVERKNVAIGDKTANLLLWDIHGETDGLIVTPSYLQGASAAVLVFDSVRPETLDMCLELGERVRAQSPDADLYLVANKADLLDGVPNDAATWQQRAGRPVVFTSAKTGDSVEDLFVDIAKAAIAKSAAS